MLPLTFLAAVLVLTAGAYIAHLTLRGRTAQKFCALAQQWRMHYSPNDRFHLTRQVLGLFPIPGASDVIVQDLIYRQEADQYRYIFTVQYTVGVVRTKSRLSCAASFLEPRDQQAGKARLELAPRDMPLLRQYVHLHQRDGHPQP